MNISHENLAKSRVVITAADSKYFGSLINLIGSINKTSGLDQSILVFDLGLTFFEKGILKNIQGVSLGELTAVFPHIHDLENFSWKIAAIKQALDTVRNGSVLWLDAGIELTKSVNLLFDVIEQDGYLFNVSPLDHANCKVTTLTKEETFDLMGERKEAFENVPMVNAGIQGYLKGHRSNELLINAFAAASDPKIICGPRNSHRHDQSVFSILRHRYQFRPQFWLIHEPESHIAEPFLIYAKSENFVTREAQISLARFAAPLALSTRLNCQFRSQKFIRYRSYTFTNKALTYLKSKFHNKLIKFKKIF